MEPEAMPVTARKIITRHQETITPETQDQVPELVECLLQIAKSGKLTCSVTMNFLRGGCTAIKTEATDETLVP